MKLEIEKASWNSSFLSAFVLNFNIPKLHNIGHYLELIELFGTADNFNTEYTERLHIDMAKEAYASMNFKDEFPQISAHLGSGILGTIALVLCITAISLFRMRDSHIPETEGAISTAGIATKVLAEIELLGNLQQQYRSEASDSHVPAIQIVPDSNTQPRT